VIWLKICKLTCDNKRRLPTPLKKGIDNHGILLIDEFPRVARTTLGDDT